MRNIFRERREYIQDLEDSVRNYKRKLDEANETIARKEREIQAEREVLQKEKNAVSEERKRLAKEREELHNAQKIRSTAASKSDRDIILDIYALASQIILHSGGMKDSLLDTQVEIKTELRFALEEMKKKITKEFLSRDDIEKALEHALDEYNWSSSFDFTSVIESAVDNAIEYRISDLQMKLDDISMHLDE